MTYTELLQQKEWWSKCNQILSRDRFTCRDCRNIGFHNGGSFIKKYNASDLPLNGLNIHHTYYIKGYMPWEYDSGALVTLCTNCHKKRHQNSSVPYYNHEMMLIGNLNVCDRCGGSGYLPQYSHVENGICFKCGGEGVILKETFK